MAEILGPFESQAVLPQPAVEQDGWSIICAVHAAVQGIHGTLSAVRSGIWNWHPMFLTGADTRVQQVTVRSGVCAEQH